MSVGHALQGVPKDRTVMYDVVIAGAGPAGSVAATVLARAGARVALIDRARFPRHKLCGDTLNPGVLTTLRRLKLASIAEACGLPVSGGGRNESAVRHGPEQHSALGSALRPSFSRRPRDGYFFRAEFQAHFASLLDERRTDPDFVGDPYSRYGGRSLHSQSHGEAFLAVLLNRIQSGVIVMDEPESALSPQRQLALLSRMAELVAAGRTQFIIATHSPVLLTFPEADIVSLDDIPMQSVRLEDTSHYQITRGILEAPERYWRLLRNEAVTDDGPA